MGASCGTRTHTHALVLRPGAVKGTGQREFGATAGPANDCCWAHHTASTVQPPSSTARTRSGADKVSIGGDAVDAAEAYYARGGRAAGDTAIEQISEVYGKQAVVVSPGAQERAAARCGAARRGRAAGGFMARSTPAGGRGCGARPVRWGWAPCTF